MSIYTEFSGVLKSSELDWACCSDVKDHIWSVKRQMSRKRLVRVVLGLKSPASTCWQTMTPTVQVLTFYSQV